MDQHRKYWLNNLLNIAHPVLKAASNKELKLLMPVESKINRRHCSHFEAIARVLAGLAPWLELKQTSAEEKQLQQEYIQLARATLDAATNPDSPDYVLSHFRASQQERNEVPIAQELVEAAFLAQAIVRAPTTLWSGLHSNIKKNLIHTLKETRKIRAVYSNWLLFSSTIETALYMMGEDFDMMRIDYALREHEAWYTGDGLYGDGPTFAWDYYNSYVIQPMLLDNVEAIAHLYQDESSFSKNLRERVLSRAQRYAQIQEMLIAPDGTFPAIGRSISYRCAAFQLLAQLALHQKLPTSLTKAQVRCALQAVITRCLDTPGTFDKEGWLRIGLAGHQPQLGEFYISTGSLYLCTTAFLPLGLPESDDFWQAADKPWSSQKIWSGENVPADQAYHE